MARMKDQKNGRLEEAMVLLIQNQAQFLARITEMDRINSERFARIEAMLAEHGRILQQLPEMLQELPEAVRQKFGFHVPQQSSSVE